MPASQFNLLREFEVPRTQAAPCPAPSRHIISGFARHSDAVGSLPESVYAELPDAQGRHRCGHSHIRRNNIRGLSTERGEWISNAHGHKPLPTFRWHGSAGSRCRAVQRGRFVGAGYLTR